MKTKTLQGVALAVLLPIVLIAGLFYKSFLPDQTIFSNDAPLGVMSAENAHIKTAWTGVWNDLNWVGISAPAALPGLAAATWMLLGNNPVAVSKFLVPFDLFFLAFSVIVCLRQFGIRHVVCGIAAIAAILNMNNFSHAAWGLPSRCTAMGFTFLAIAALRGSVSGHWLPKALLAGLAVGMGILEAYDVGAIFSLYVGVFAIFVVLNHGKIDAKHTALAIVRTAVVALFAAVCAAAGLSTLIGTQVQGISGMQQDEATRQARWDGATMWSLPKAETLRVISPGLFGYRMDAEDGGNYWGSAGQSPGVLQSRHSGSGEYAGALVVVIAAFGVANGFRKKNGPFTDVERRVVLFFSAAALISLLLAWGRHAPFYRMVYALPFFSTIRNPMKFMHPFHLSLIILFGFGLEALIRVYVKEAEGKVVNFKTALSSWWKNASPFERKWTYASLGTCGLFLLISFIYISSRKDLLSYLRECGFPPETAEKIASFTYAEAVQSWGLITVSVLMVTAALSGWFSGKRARYFIALCGLFITFDLAHSNRPWLQYYNYKERYASNAVIEFLRKDAHEHRVTARVTPFGSNHLVVEQPGPMNSSFFAGVANQWLQHHFQYYNIQSLEPVQMPRPPEIDENFFKALFPSRGSSPTVITRLWELTNTRYLLGDKNFITSLLQQLEPGQQRIRTLLTFDMAPKPGVQMERATIDDLTWVENPNGRFVIAEFTGALPRASLFPAWQKVTDDNKALQELASPSFNPHTNLFIHGDVPIIPSALTNFAGSATITHYKPKNIELSVTNNAPAILLYNDKLAADWKLWVDGKPENFVRANYIMRGIPLPAGNHTVVMKYSTSTTGLYISLTGFAVAFAALAFVLWSAGRNSTQSVTQ